MRGIRRWGGGLHAHTLRNASLPEAQKPSMITRVDLTLIAAWEKGLLGPEEWPVDVLGGEAAVMEAPADGHAAAPGEGGQ